MRNKFLTAVLFAALMLVLAACSSADSEKPAETEQPDAEQTDTEKDPAAIAPVVIDNEGFTMEYDKAPERAISVNQHVTEIMLALGLEDSMAGTAYLDDEVYEPLKEAYEKVPVLAERYPSKEQIIDAEADFIYGGWSSAFGEKGIASREELKELGIGSYLQSSSTNVGPTIDDIFADIRNIAKIFRVEDRADKLIDDMMRDIEGVLDVIPEDAEKLNVLVFDSGDTEVFTAAQNFMNTLVSMAGANNIFSDVDGNWATVSKEDAVDRNPDMIVVIDYGETTAQEKIDFLKADPALSQTPAVENEKFTILPLSAASEGVRVPEALEILAKGFYPEVFN